MPRPRSRAAGTTAELDEAETAVLGKRSELAGAHRSLGGLDPDARRAVGQSLHELRGRLETAAAARRAELAGAERVAALEADRMDLTEVVVSEVRTPVLRGHRHLVTTTRDALEDVFVAMGFTVAEGPEAETDWYNFEALNIPPAHPARGMYDTFYLDLGEPETIVLRTHTSPVQIRLMEKAVASGSIPIHSVIPGRCYRRDTPTPAICPSSTRSRAWWSTTGSPSRTWPGPSRPSPPPTSGPAIHSRLRPSYFPFTEPSAEYDITCTICMGAGCRTCSYTGWLELGGCGMVDPAVFEAVGIDPVEWSGFALGFGIERCAQMHHEIADMRSLVENDLRFLRQYLSSGRARPVVVAPRLRPHRR